MCELTCSSEEHSFSQSQKLNSSTGCRRDDIIMNKFVNFSIVINRILFRDGTVHWSSILIAPASY